jgi:hypothetical protein
MVKTWAKAWFRERVMLCMAVRRVVVALIIIIIIIIISH